jgi:ABC-type antimicrobial peptide transport system permease subunit
MKHLPILLVLIVACANVGTLVYARTATRDAEIATRYALGATRGRIITQLFIEALVLASVAAFVGLAVANRALKWGYANPLAIGVRMSGDPAALAARLRPTAASLDAGLRLESVRSLDELAWRVDMPQMVVAGAIVSAVGLGLFLSAAGIFSLMSVSVSLRTREIGLRSALGATSLRLLTGIFSRAAVLVGGGVVAGNLVLILLVILAEEIELADVANALMITSAIMLTAGLLACIEPGRRALRINPTDALKEM